MSERIDEDPQNDLVYCDDGIDMSPEDEALVELIKPFVQKMAPLERANRVAQILALSSNQATGTYIPGQEVFGQTSVKRNF